MQKVLEVQSADWKAMTLELENQIVQKQQLAASLSDKLQEEERKCQQHETSLQELESQLQESQVFFFCPYLWLLRETN